MQAVIKVELRWPIKDMPNGITVCHFILSSLFKTKNLYLSHLDRKNRRTKRDQQC